MAAALAGLTRSIDDTEPLLRGESPAMGSLRGRDGVARAALGLSVALGAAALLAALLLRPRPLEIGLAVAALAALPVTLVGAAAVRARSGGAVGWLLLAGGVALPLATVGYVYAQAAFARGLLGASWAGWLDGWPWVPGVVLVPTVGVLLFPDGRLPSRRWAPVLALDLLVALCLMLWTVLGTELIDFPGRHNPTALPGAAGEGASALVVAIALVAPLTTLSAVAVTLRWRRHRGTAIGRALARVVATALVCAAAWWGCVVVTSVFGDDASVYVAPFESGGMLAVAVACWVGIRRYGLLDVRVVLSTAAVWTVLTATVVVVYVVVAAVVGDVAGAASGPVGAAVALLVALPLRDWLQRRVTRLVFGDRENPRRAIDRLEQRLSDAADGEHVLDAVAVVVRDALRLERVEVEVHGQGVAAGGEPGGPASLELPLVFAGERIGRLTAYAGPERVLTPPERALLGDLARQVASAAHAVALAADLARSRERLVSATAEERLRLRRDLHDGLGPALAGVVLGLHRARSRVTSDPAGAREQLDELTRQVQEAVADVRRLVYGLRPPALDELGLLGAIAEHAEVLGGVEVRGELPGTLPAAVEVAAYRIALEAMTNAVRHGGSRWCRVAVELDGALHVVVEDDGIGLPRQYRAGVGITSMRERAVELGGTCTITRREPRGTTVRAVLPILTPARAS